MKKNSSMQGTLNKLFGKKNSGNNSLYAENPPWMKPQGVKKASVDYQDEVHNSFSFLDDSGTATLKARPGPRVRPVLQFSTSNTDAQGLAVPTPLVPSGYSNLSIGNGPKLNGSYRMYSSVGDLRGTNYYDYLDEEIPAPPSVPPPPPPTMIPPQESPPSSTISSPVSPSLPDFIPPTPNSSTTIPNFETSTGTSKISASEQHQTENVSKWKTEGAKDMPVGLPNKFSLNTIGFQHSHGQTTNDVDPHSSLPKSFKVPPPAPVRTSSMQLQELQNISYSTEPPPSPVPSSFKPSIQARLFSTSNQEQISLNDTLNKRKSMLIMEDLQDLSQDHAIQKNISITDKTQNVNRRELEPGINDVQKQYNKMNTNGSELQSVVSGKMNYVSKRPLSSIEFNKMSIHKDGFVSNGHKSTKDAVRVISVKPILTDMSFSHTNEQSNQNSLTMKMMNRKEMSGIESDVKMDEEKSAEIIYQQAPPTPPSMPPPPPPMMTPPKPPAVPPPPPPLPVTVTPQKTSPMPNFVAPPPAPPLMASMPPVPQASSLLPPKPKTISATSTSPVIIPPQAPPKAPPAPPPLPTQTANSTAEPQLPLLKALQEKQQTLKHISKKSIEVRPAHISSINVTNDDEQKARVGKIKGELEALFSPKKDEKVKDLKISRPSPEVKKKSPNGNNNHKSGENTLVNSLMRKVPLIPPISDKEDVDGDSSDWIIKSNNTNFKIPDPDYLPISPKRTMETLAYSNVQSDIVKPISDSSSKPESPLKAPDLESKSKNDMPTYKPHHERKASSGSLLSEKLPIAVSETTKVVSLRKDEEIPYSESTSLKSVSLIKEDEGINKHPVTDEQVGANSPMALLLAAKKRAQKGSRSMPLEHGNLPKISVSSGTVTSSLASQYNDVKSNTFVVVPKKEIGEQFSQEEVTSFSSRPSIHSDNISSPSKWTNGDIPSSSLNILGLNPQKSDDEKGSFMQAKENIFGQVSTEARNEDSWKVRSPVTENHNSTNLFDTYKFNISSVPSPVPASKTYEDIDYGIIPPPAEFMNSPLSTDMHQKDRLYIGNRTKADLGSDYDWNNESNRSLGFQTVSNSSDFNRYTNDSYSTGISRDPHKVSLIKKRLYMPDPESSGSYGRNANSLRSSALPVSYSHMHTQSNFGMVPESRRSSNPSRYMSQGRRISSENINKMVPTMTDMKYKPQNPEYGKSMSRPSTYQQGMTFTVRPGTRQPISQMYQGGYL